jgi:hypothetical protein
MRIDDEWFERDDGVVRPVKRVEILAAAGVWAPAFFLVDTGADRSVFTAGLRELIGIAGTNSDSRVGGVGGLQDAIEIAVRIRLTTDDGRKPIIRGSFAALTRDEALDINVLGRDVLDLFAVIVDRPGDTIAHIGQRHYYSITT